MEALKGVTDPEAKRKIIGNLFIRVFEEEAEKLGDFAFWPRERSIPIIESGSGGNLRRRIITSAASRKTLISN